VKAIGEGGLEQSGSPSASRECGDCTLCCKLLGVKKISKPQGQWCQHCQIGKGCKIYAQRPKECEDFTCLWWAGLIPEELKPNKVHAVFTLTGETITVDAEYANVFEQGPVKRYIDKLLKNGKRVEVYA
jgi:hypothetical protein